MTTTINGITFTDTPPSKAGAYWCILNGDENHTVVRPSLREIFNPVGDVLIDRRSDWKPKDIARLWSACLVPADEVEKAYKEGYHEHLFQVTDESTLHGVNAGYEHSRARRVANGEL